MASSQSPIDLTVTLGPVLERAWDEMRAEWWRRGGTKRLLARDVTLFTGGDEDRYMGWVDAPARFADFASWDETGAFAAIRRSEVDRVVLLGMGGSSLGPLVLGSVLEPLRSSGGAPKLHVLDSTDPRPVSRVLESSDPERTLVVAASKSGGTLETRLLLDVFWERFAKALSPPGPGSRFLAITDPGSALEALAREREFAAVVLGDPTIGGRFSVLSPFGLAPALLAGLDAQSLVAGACAAHDALAGESEQEPSRATRLGTLLAAAASSGQFALPVQAEPGLVTLAGWLEQLVAESIGKKGRLLLPYLPAEGSPLGTAPPASRTQLGPLIALSYQEQRPTICEEASPRERDRVELCFATIASGALDPQQLGAFFFDFEVATAIAASLIGGLDPFVQPDVEAAKLRTRSLCEVLDETGALPVETPVAVQDGVRLFATHPGQSAQAQSLQNSVEAFFEAVAPQGYLAFLFYGDLDSPSATLRRLRQDLEERYGYVTTLGWGPRYLHSTGQGHKGGPPVGSFVILVDQPELDVELPDSRYGLHAVRDAQARGDHQALEDTGASVIRLEADSREDLEHLTSSLSSPASTALGSSQGRTIS